MHADLDQTAALQALLAPGTPFYAVPFLPVVFAPITAGIGHAKHASLALASLGLGTDATSTTRYLSCFTPHPAFRLSQQSRQSQQAVGVHSHVD